MVVRKKVIYVLFDLLRFLRVSLRAVGILEVVEQVFENLLIFLELLSLTLVAVSSAL